MAFSEYGGKFQPEQEPPRAPIDVYFDQVVERLRVFGNEEMHPEDTTQPPLQIRQRLRQEYPWKEIRYLLSLQTVNPDLITLEAINSTILSTPLDTVENTELAKSAIITLLVNTVAQGRFEVAHHEAQKFVESNPTNADLLLGVITNEQTLKAPPEFTDSIVEIIKNSGSVDQKNLDKSLKRIRNHTEKNPAERLQKIVHSLTTDANSAFAQDLPEYGERFVDLITIIDPDFDEQVINRQKKENQTLSNLDAAGLMERLNRSHPNNLNEKAAIIGAMRRFESDPHIARIIKETEAHITSIAAAREQAALEKQKQASQPKAPPCKVPAPKATPPTSRPAKEMRPTYSPIAEAAEIKDLIKAGFTVEAKKILKPIALANPDHPEALLLVALLALAQKDASTARSAIEHLQGRINPIEQRRLLGQLFKVEHEDALISRQSAKGTIWGSLGAREPINRTAHNVTRESPPKNPKGRT